MTRFHDPAWFAVLAAVPVLAWWALRRARIGALNVSHVPTVSGRWRLHLALALRLAALVPLTVALARPQIGHAWEESLTEGIDIQIVLDISGSMAAEDFKPRNRLHVAKDVVSEFIAGRTGDRLGLTVFSGTALTRSPLTTDREILQFLVDSVELHTLPDGTAIGVALASAAARLESTEAESKVLVLVTDGVNNAGSIDPLSAAAICKGLGIRVYTVGVGTAGRVPVPVQVENPVSGRRETRRVLLDVEVDEDLLREIATRTGGEFFQALDADGLRRVFERIDELETTEIATRTYVRYEESFAPWAWAALLLVLLPIPLAWIGWTYEP